MKRKYNNPNSSQAVQFINNAGFIEDGSFSDNDNNADFAEKRALILVEGTHRDSNKRVHTFDAKRIQEIVNNTNQFLANGGRIPWQKDHKKEQAYNIGDLESQLEVRVITEKDLPNNRLKHLIGKVGVFAERLVAKGIDNVQQVLSKNISTLSPGIDIVNNIIKEISATPTPAIVGPSTFSRYAAENTASFALTLDEAEMEDMNMDAAKEEFEDLTERFWNVITNIRSATEEELQGADPYALMEQAINDLNIRIYDMIGLNEGQMDPQEQPGQAPSPMRGQRMPNYMRNQQEIRPTNAAYSMADMEIALFAAQQQERKRGSMLGTAATAGAIGVGGVGAVRYGRAAMRGMKSATRLQNRTGKQIGRGAGAMGGIRRAVGRDFQRVGRGINRMTAGKPVVGGLSRVGNAAVGLGRRIMRRV